MKTSILRIGANNYYITALLIIAFIFLNYLPALDIYLMGDDFELLHESYRGWHDPSILLKPVNKFFRPLVKLSFLVDYTLFGTDVVYYKLTTILFHLVNVFLLFLLIYRISGKRYLAGLTALAFGSSPMYSEVVFWASGRTESLSLMFMLGALLLLPGTGTNPKKGLTRWIAPLFLTVCAIGSKETWILLPVLAFSYVWIVKRESFTTSLKRTSVFFVLLIIYLGYFIAFPLVSGTTAPTAYAGLNFSEMVVKFQHIILHYVGMESLLADDAGHFLLFLLIILLLSALAYRLIRTKNGLALWGLIWMVVGIAISLPIRFMPSRYNYLPLLGFWVMVIASLDHEFKQLSLKFKIKPRTVSLGIAMLLILLLTYNAIFIQWEINDYRIQGQAHRDIVDMYNQAKARIPRDKPILFVNASRRKSVQEFSQSTRGYRKVLFIRDKAIRQLIFISPLANFLGDPFSEMMEPIPNRELDAVIEGEFNVLAFNDTAFFIVNSEAPRLREFYRNHGELPYKVEAVRFVKTNM